MNSQVQTILKDCARPHLFLNNNNHDVAAALHSALTAIYERLLYACWLPL